MRVTFDTNVLISAPLWFGAPAKLMEKVREKELVLVLSPYILQEYDEAMFSPEMQAKIVKKQLIMFYTKEKILSMAEIVVPAIELSVVEQDPDDNAILACALEGDAEYLVTRDKALLSIRCYAGISILKPEELILLCDGRGP